jgi:hypothetical protein
MAVSELRRRVGPAGALSREWKPRRQIRRGGRCCEKHPSSLRRPRRRIRPRGGCYGRARGASSLGLDLATTLDPARRKGAKRVATRAAWRRRRRLGAGRRRAHVPCSSAMPELLREAGEDDYAGGWGRQRCGAPGSWPWWCFGRRPRGLVVVGAWRLRELRVRSHASPAVVAPLPCSPDFSPYRRDLHLHW